MITIVKQVGASAFRYRVEITDANGFGLGYGDTPRMAYADAREDYQQYRASQTRMGLKDADREFAQQGDAYAEPASTMWVGLSKSEVDHLTEFHRKAAHS